MPFPLKGLFSPTEQVAAQADSAADIDGQISEAFALGEYVRSSFATAANDLTAAADQHELAAQLAQERIDELTKLRDDVLAYARADRDAAEKIRSLLS